MIHHARAHHKEERRNTQQPRGEKRCLSVIYLFSVKINYRYGQTCNDRIDHPGSVEKNSESKNHGKSRRIDAVPFVFKNNVWISKGVGDRWRLKIPFSDAVRFRLKQLRDTVFDVRNMFKNVPRYDVCFSKNNQRQQKDA